MKTPHRKIAEAKKVSAVSSAKQKGKPWPYLVLMFKALVITVYTIKQI